MLLALCCGGQFSALLTSFALFEDSGRYEATYNDLILGREPEQASNRTEGLLGRNELMNVSATDSSRVLVYTSVRTYTFIRDVGQDGGHVLGPVAPLAANQDLGTLGHGVLDVLVSFSSWSGTPPQTAELTSSTLSACRMWMRGPWVLFHQLTVTMNDCEHELTRPRRSLVRP